MGKEKWYTYMMEYYHTIKKNEIEVEQDGRGVGRCGVHLSPWIHQEYTFRHRRACRTLAMSAQEYLASEKAYIEPHKGGRMKELGEKTGELVRLDLSSAGGEAEGGVQSPQRGDCLSQRRNM